MSCVYKFEIYLDYFLMTRDWSMERKWRLHNKIKGKCYYFQTRVPFQKKHYCYIPGVLRPSAICLSTNKTYFIHENPMGWDIIYMTDNEQKFDEVTRDAWGGEKGLLRNLTCWDVLAEMQREGGQYYELDIYPLYVNVKLS